jgi:hypothetical protein
MAQSSRTKKCFLNVEFVSLVAEFIRRQFHAEKLFLLSFLIFKNKVQYTSLYIYLHYVR